MTLKERKKTLIFFVISFALPCSCSIKDSPSDTIMETEDLKIEENILEISNDGDIFEITPDPDSASKLNGTWGQIQVVSHISNFPGYNAVATISRMWQLVTMKANENGIVDVEETMCKLEVETPQMPVQTIVPDNLVAHLNKTTRHAVVDGTGSGSHFESDTMVEVRGCILQNPFTDELCYSPDDPRVIDQDEDGHPGITLNFTGAVNAAVYVTQRWTSKFYQGTFDGSGNINGFVFSTSEQQILDSTNPVLDGPDPDPPELGSWPDPDSNNSFFHLFRLQENSNCNDVLLNAPNI